MPPRDPALAEVLQARLARLHGEARARRTLPRLLALIERWRPRMPPRGDRPDLDERDVVLIAYPDHLARPGEAPLATLRGWCRAHLAGCISTVHVLPFHPSTSYEGYAITDYSSVDPRLGSWADLEALAADSGLMVDLVLNHCSASHPWFRQLLRDEEPGRRYFVTVPDPQAPWLGAVHRARDLPLIHTFETAAGPRHVWTTYSPDLVDLDWREPDLALEMLEVLLEHVARGARGVRLDAHVYVWKEEGTTGLDRPEGHELIRLFQDVLRAAGAASTAILPSITNVTQAANFAYLGAGEPDRQADLIYHLPLSALLLHALYAHDARALAGWLAALPAAPPGRAYLNLAASHDGVGLTWLDGVIPPDEVARVVAAATARGALLSSRRTTAQGEVRPWELNTTYFSACAPDAGEPPSAHAARLLATHAVLLALRGVPALYLATLVAGRNDLAAVARTGDNRAINRGRYDIAAWEAALEDATRPEAAVLRGLTALLRARRGSPAFHPEAAQAVVDLGHPAVLGLRRTAPGTSVLCVTSFSADPVTLPCAHVGPAGRLRDLVTGREVDARAPLELAPYGTAWLAP